MMTAHADGGVGTAPETLLRREIEAGSAPRRKVPEGALGPIERRADGVQDGVCAQVVTLPGHDLRHVGPGDVPALAWGGHPSRALERAVHRASRPLESWVGGVDDGVDGEDDVPHHETEFGRRTGRVRDGDDREHLHPHGIAVVIAWGVR